MYLGKVKWYNNKKKYGFIVCEGKSFYFNVKNSYFSPKDVVESGENVVFHLRTYSDGKTEAVEVASLDRD